LRYGSRLHLRRLRHPDCSKTGIPSGQVPLRRLHVVRAIHMADSFHSARLTRLSLAHQRGTEVREDPEKGETDDAWRILSDTAPFQPLHFLPSWIPDQTSPSSSSLPQRASRKPGEHETGDWLMHLFLCAPLCPLSSKNSSSSPLGLRAKPALRNLRNLRSSCSLGLRAKPALCPSEPSVVDSSSCSMAWHQRRVQQK